MIARHLDILEIRRTNLRAEAQARGGNAALAEALGKSDSQISQIIGKNPIRGIGPVQARAIEKKLKLAPFTLDIPPSPYTELVQKIAEEVSKRSEDAQQELLGVIRRIPEDPSRPTLARDRRAAAG